jgi:hypothetical protein
MDDPVKETIIIVHGTWAAPEPVKRKWYEPIDDRPGAEPFVEKLDAALRARGSSARCWAHCTRDNRFFHWTGGNTWAERIQGASELIDHITRLRADGWRFHIIAHSHGGNVATDALRSLSANPDTYLERQCGKILFLGTPFIDILPKFSLQLSYRTPRFKIAVNLLYYLAFGFLTYVACIALRAALVLSPPVIVPIGVLSWAFWCLFRAGAFLSWRNAGATTRSSKRDVLLQIGKSSGIGRKRILIINSPYDEAWQLLHQMSNMANPLEVSEGIFRFFCTKARKHVKTHLVTDFGTLSLSRLRKRQSKVQAVISQTMKYIWAFACTYFICFIVFYIFMTLVGWNNPRVAILNNLYQYVPYFGGVVVAPILFATFIFSMKIAEPMEVLYAMTGLQYYGVRPLLAFPAVFITYIVRQYGWRVLQKRALGLEGYSWKSPKVRRIPAFVSRRLFEYEDMPLGVEQRALQRREQGLGQQLRVASDLFAKSAMADTTALLKAIASDVSVIHAAYYTDDECIARMADWIAGRGDDSPVAMG